MCVSVCDSGVELSLAIQNVAVISIYQTKLRKQKMKGRMSEGIEMDEMSGRGVWKVSMDLFTLHFRIWPFVFKDIH